MGNWFKQMHVSELQAAKLPSSKLARKIAHINAIRNVDIKSTIKITKINTLEVKGLTSYLRRTM